LPLMEEVEWKCYLGTESTLLNQQLLVCKSSLPIFTTKIEYENFNGLFR
jgi:hypothetical protein